MDAFALEGSLEGCAGVFALALDRGLERSGAADAAALECGTERMSARPCLLCCFAEAVLALALERELE